MNEQIKQQIIRIYRANPSQGFVDFLVSLDQIKANPQEVVETLKELIVTKRA